MLISEANKITGGLSNPSKMPGRAYNLSAFDCDMGSKLAEKPGSVCEDCYARKGRYRFKNVKAAQARRLNALNHPSWVPAMVRLIDKQSPAYFRWHDSGDLQNLEHLMMICRIAELTPLTSHWLPTKEYGIVNEFLKTHNFPSNLIVRVSAPFIDQLPKMPSGVLGSMVSSKMPIAPSHICPASTQGNVCGDCRACWGQTPIIAYPKH